jgi:hypothetical protein
LLCVVVGGPSSESWTFAETQKHRGRYDMSIDISQRHSDPSHRSHLSMCFVARIWHAWVGTRGQGVTSRRSPAGFDGDAVDSYSGGMFHVSKTRECKN